MLRKLMIALAMAGATLATAPTAFAEPQEGCLLRSGCFMSNGSWVCSDPRIYMLCDEPAGGV